MGGARGGQGAAAHMLSLTSATAHAVVIYH